MSEERLERLENLMMDLIKMVGANNAVVAEMKTDVAGLKTDVAGLKIDVAGLKTDVAGLKKTQELFREELFTQSARMDDMRKDIREIKERLFDVNMNANYAVSMATRHDKEIFIMKEKLSL
ncbi:MAG: hypothetical protein ACOY35_12700 [Bacillota bacterium]|nr:hypothetical protein [Bacillota bacterium]